MTKTANNYLFELMCIDPADISNELSLAQALCFSKSLWAGQVPKIHTEGHITKVKSEYDGVEIIIKQIDTRKAITTFFDSGFVITLMGQEFDAVEDMRVRLLKHLKNTLKFTHIRLLTDDVSTYIANQLYPEINKIENLLRRYLVKFFLQRIGIDWWETTANKQMIDKAKLRKANKIDEISLLIDDEIRYVDFDDLGELIYKQTSGYNNPDKVVQRLLNMSSNDDFRSLQNELQSNYTKYFKQNFQDKQFEQKWKEIIRLRHKVAHQSVFNKHDLQFGLEILKSLSDIILNAEKHIDSLVFSIEDKEAILTANIESRLDSDSNIGIKILGKVDLQENYQRNYNQYKNIEEEEMLEELFELEYGNKRSNAKFIGLKWFITDYLAQKDYNISSSYILVNILIDKGKINKYEVEGNSGYTIVAIRTPLDNLH